METSIPGVSPSELRYVLQARARLRRPFTAMDMDDAELDGIAMAVLEADPDDAEVALIGLDREERGYLTIGNVAAILNWIVARAQHPLPPAAPVRCGGCHRPLTDAVSRRRGYGPACWARVGDDTRRHHPGGQSAIQLALPLPSPVIHLVEVSAPPADGSATDGHGQGWWVLVMPIIPNGAGPRGPWPRVPPRSCTPDRSRHRRGGAGTCAAVVRARVPSCAQPSRLCVPERPESGEHLDCPRSTRACP